MSKSKLYLTRALTDDVMLILEKKFELRFNSFDRGATLGVIGAGRIGSAVMKRAHGFGMNVLFYNRTSKEIEGASQVEFDYLLKESDFISLNVPYTKETHHLLGRYEFNLMKQNCIVVNTARGVCIDE